MTMDRLLIAALAALLAACGGGGGAAPAPVGIALGDPNPGLSADTYAAFERGRDLFVRRFAQSEGHGPDFNTSSCRSCHGVPVPGGSAERYRDFILAGRFVNNVLEGAFDNKQLVARNFSYVRPHREPMPDDADVIANRNAPAMFGMGLLERIPALDIRRNADELDADGDGISGSFNRDGFQVGRFGFKAQTADLEGFVRGPLFNHLGITTDPLSAGGGTPQVVEPGESNSDDDGVADPELSRSDLLDLLVFVRELAPPEPETMDAEAQRGETLFEQIRCADCHIPNVVQTGAPVLAYSDLLLHEMGPALADGIEMSNAMGDEFRTAPLWGLRHHAPYLHDGRADTIEQAIVAHGGEASASQALFTGLGAADRAALIRFLETR